MTLHDRIMRMDVSTLSGDNSFHEGVTVAKMKAAQLATEADELMAEMAGTIAVMTRWINEGGSNQWNESINDICRMGEKASEKYKTYMERNNEQ